MRAILQKTIGPNFKAGDVITGENRRIRRLSDKGIATLDHSLTGMTGAIINIIFAAILLAVTAMTFSPDYNHFYFAPGMDLWWKITFVILLVCTILLNVAYLINAQIPYVAYFTGFGVGIIGCALILYGHETTRSKYQSAPTSATAGIILITIASFMFVIGLVTNIDSVISFTDIRRPNTISFVMWLIYMILLVVGVVFAMYFDIDFQNRRKRYIAFLQKKNATIEYKTKALNAYRAYQKTGNAEKFLINNIEFMEEQLGIDRSQVEEQIKKSNEKK